MASTPVGTGTGTSSPMKRTVNGISQYEASKKKAVDLREDLADEMIGYWGGAMDPREFLKTQLVVVDEEIPKKFNADFKKVLQDVKLEDDMYQPLIEAIEKANVLTEDFVLRNTSSQSEATTKQRPDISMFRTTSTLEDDPPISQASASPDDDAASQASSELTALSDMSPRPEPLTLDADVDSSSRSTTPSSDSIHSEYSEEKPGVAERDLPSSSEWKWHKLELWVELKLHETADGFTKDYKNTQNKCFDHVKSQLAKETRGQLASYATKQLAHQHRRFIISLLIVGKYARFILFDRGGALVTEHFNYIKKPELLAEFFWRYSRTSDHHRGYDLTAPLATPAEQAALEAAATNFKNDATKRKFADIETALDARFPCYKLAVKGIPSDSKTNLPETRHYIVRTPFRHPESPCGRATRPYVALDLASDQLVFLKDYWRPVDEGRPSEAEVYAELNAANVPHLPNVLLAGDVVDPDVDGVDVLQSTATHVLLEAVQTKKLFKSPGIKQYRHHRIVQTLLYPLKSAKNSRELVKAIYNATECILAAKEADWLHRDVSAANVMLDEDGEGVLNDWDHATKSHAAQTLAYSRTGTWQFMSIELGRNPYKAHDVFDDIESCLWVFLNSAIHFFDSDASYSTLDMFDHSEEGRHAIYGSFTKGGNAKRNYVIDDQDYVKFSSTALHEAVSEAVALVAYYHFTLTGHFREHLSSAQQLLKWDPSQPPVHGTRTPLLQHLAEVLDRDDWPASDTVSDRFPRIRETVLTKDSDRDKAARVGSSIISQSLPLQSLEEVPDKRDCVAAANRLRVRKRSAQEEAGNEESTGGVGKDKRRRTATGRRRPEVGSHGDDQERSHAAESRETQAIRNQAPLPRRSTRSRGNANQNQEST
ncbi:hypothetical protein EIP91_012073 [Steccherinum ochraceum]|uniref:Fungal-type protein kinase domain-containing protein n=1 Tax=Steccherinum ochraceum TaxID=92696 RepID=A0A4R0RWB2_9APHY|nr:hypothetical protein EIP91_012073 [Steccherinum ochraceum]